MQPSPTTRPTRWRYAPTAPARCCRWIRVSNFYRFWVWTLLAGTLWVVCLQLHVVAGMAGPWCIGKPMPLNEKGVFTLQSLDTTEFLMPP